MRASMRYTLVATLVAFIAMASQAQQNKKVGILDATELKQVAPTTYFFDGQVAPVQMRNTVAIRLADGKIVQAGFVDNSGYSSDVAAKYQGFLITEEKITIEDQALSPGQYGFGFANGKFRVMDVAGSDVFLVDHKTDDTLKRPVPLKATEDSGSYRLYAGKKYVTIKTK